MGVSKMSSSIGSAFPGDDAAILKRQIKKLPKLAQAKLKAREQADLEASGRSYARFEKTKKLRADRDELTAQIVHLQRHAEHATLEKAEAERLAELFRERDEVKAEILQVQSENDTIMIPRAERKKASVAAKLAPSIEDWLLSRPREERYCERRAELIKLSKGETFADALAKNRAEQDEIITKLVAIEGAPLDLATALAAMRRDVAKLAAQGAPNVNGVLRFTVKSLQSGKSQGEVTWPTENLFQPNLGSSYAVPLGTAMLAWLFPAELEARLESIIRAKAGTGNGLTVVEREAAQMELAARLLDLQRTEERVIYTMEEQGIKVERSSRHPMAFLEIDVVAAEPKPRQISRNEDVHDWQKKDALEI
jgi:hypothetical protein